MSSIDQREHLRGAVDQHRDDLIDERLQRPWLLVPALVDAGAEDGPAHDGGPRQLRWRACEEPS